MPSQHNTHRSTNQSKCSTHSGLALTMPDGNVKISENPDVLEVIKEEQQHSPQTSMKLPTSAVSQKSYVSQQSSGRLGCFCGAESGAEILRDEMVIEEIDRLLKERELQLRAEYDKLLDKELKSERERFDFIIQNEQMRTSYMLREAHRERQEKIRALERQLECKNLSALMYVMCTERSRGKLEKLRLIEEYTLYIQALQELLIQGQQLILHLSRGYKTAARVDQEWREKMKKVVSEFMNFIYHFAGGPPENNQYFLNIPKILKTEAAVQDDPLEDPCEDLEEDDEEVSPEELDACDKPWWETLEGDDRPFVIFGDMADFKPPQRREVLKTIKAAKTAPKCWKQYKFNDLCIKSTCENADDIKDLVYLGNVPDVKHMLAMLDKSDSLELQAANGPAMSRLSFASRRQTALSIDIRGGDMGSILRIMTSANTPAQPTDKAALLGARDSIEIASTTRMRQSITEKSIRSEHTIPENVKINLGKKMVSRFDHLLEEEMMAEEEASATAISEKAEEAKVEDEEDDEDTLVSASIHSGLNGHTDSLQVITTHVPEKDHKINYERVCPMEACQRMQVDSFMRSLPSYMRANPFTHFEQTYEAYEPCTQEQLDILRERMEAKEPYDFTMESLPSTESVLREWAMGIATQTSIQSFDQPCTCADASATPVDSEFIFDLRDLVPVKQLLDAIQKECLHDQRIEFNRFQVVGENNEDAIKPPREKEFSGARARGITNILKQHPSLLEIFQANTRC